jgi:hypothetical protein
MFAETTKKSKLSHGSVCKCGMLKHSLDLLNSNCIINVLVLAGLDYD